jgi:hypothetical protein
VADAMTENILGVIDKRDVQGSNANPYSATTVGGNVRDIAAARARLTAISAATYPAATLDKMTFNDMIYAIRINDEAAGLNW